MQATTFWNFDMGHVIEIGALAVAALAYRSDRKKDASERSAAREKMVTEQVEMHSENRQRLDSLAEFHKAQQVLNTKRDEQISQLMQQTATMVAMASGMDRRLEMLENERRRSA